MGVQIPHLAPWVKGKKVSKAAVLTFFFPQKETCEEPKHLTTVKDKYPSLFHNKENTFMAVSANASAVSSL